MKKLIPALLALCILLSSCGIIALEYDIADDTASNLSGGAPTTSYTDAPDVKPVTLPELDPELDANKLLATLPDMDFQEKYFGENENANQVYFTVATVNDAPIFSSSDEISGSSVASALNDVEAKFNIDIVNIPYSEEEFDAKVKDSQLSGKYFADLLSVPASMARSYASSEYCSPISSLPFVNKNAPYFLKDTFEYGGELAAYALISDASYLKKDLFCVYFDTSAVGGDAYAKALSKELTWEYFFEIMDKTGRGISSFADLEDLYRLSCGARFANDQGASALMTSPFAPKTEDSSLLDALDGQIKRVLTYKTEEDPIFIVDTLGNYAKYTSDKAPYGILPLPSYDGSPAGFVSAENVNYFMCPKSTTTTEGAGLVISALAAGISQREESTLLTLIRDNARDNGTLLVSHLLFTKPAWDNEW